MLLLLLAACGGASSPSSLVRTEVEPPGENCENGGITLSTGTDDDGDGTLGDGEIDATEFVCDGATGADGEDGEDGATALLEMTEEPPGDNCEEGGVRVVTGVDDDGDGTLDPEEIDQTEYVCDGATGDVTIASVTTEAAGGNCPYGGQRLDTGIDDDGDGVLDEGEVLGTSYVCNGATGDDGAEALVSTADEPAGANCATGGVAVSVGTDEDGDGALSPTEVDTTFYVCDGATGSGGSGGGIAGTIVAGDYTVSNSLEADLLDGVEQITGTLTIYGSSMGDIELPDLVQVGSLTIGEGGFAEFAPDSLSLPSLTTVDADVLILYTTLADWSGFDTLTTVGDAFGMYYCGGVSTLDAFNGLSSVGSFALHTESDGTPPSVIDGFDSLVTVAGGFTLSLDRSGAATAITGFTRLEDVGGTFGVSAPPTLTDLSGMGALRTVTGIFGVSYAGLADFSDFTSLTSVGSIYIYEPEALVDLDGLTGITAVTGDVTLQGVTTLTSISGLDNLQSVGGSLVIGGATALTDLSPLGRLTTVGGSLQLAHATSLPDLDGLDSLTTVDGQLYLYDLTSLTNVDALANLTTASDLVVYSTALTDLDGLANLDVAEYGDVNVYGNASLTDITGLSGITGQVQYLYIGSNTALTTLDGLEGITRLGGATSGSTTNALYVAYNTALTDVTGLYNVTAIDYGATTFTYNTSLCNSAILSLRINIGTGDILEGWGMSSNRSC